MQQAELLLECEKRGIDGNALDVDGMKTALCPGFTGGRTSSFRIAPSLLSHKQLSMNRAAQLKPLCKERDVTTGKVPEMRAALLAWSKKQARGMRNADLKTACKLYDLPTGTGTEMKAALQGWLDDDGTRDSGKVPLPFVLFCFVLFYRDIDVTPRLGSKATTQSHPTVIAERPASLLFLFFRDIDVIFCFGPPPFCFCFFVTSMSFSVLAAKQQVRTIPQ